MRDKRGLFYFIILILVMLTGIGVIGFKLYRNTDIEYILKTDVYSYLPKSAMNYIREVYENTGEILLTERNKQENKPYLNPRYVEYLNSTEEEKKSFALIPNETIIDYVYAESENSELEDYYNISSIDINDDGIVDKNYTTPMKNQGSLGLCWAYTLTEIAESYMMNKKQETYQAGVTKLLSPRQLDYVLSSSIVDYINEYNTHFLGSGGSFMMSTKVLVDGLSFFDSSWKYHNSVSLDKLEYSDVFNDTHSQYELEETIEMPFLNARNLNLSNSYDLQMYNTYINSIKTYLKQYGALYVGTEAPGYSCSAINVYDTDHHIIDSNETCAKDGAHAMQIIGWDDNYSYKYCVDGDSNVKWTSSCSLDNTVSGKGAWILRNSWGNHSDQYTYLTYNSVDTDYNFISSLVSMEDREWDYIYNEQNKNIILDSESIPGSYKYKYLISLLSSFDVNAKLIKLKFRNGMQNASYDIYVSQTGDDSDYVKVSSEVVRYPGYVTIDLSNSDFFVTNDMKIKIEASANIQESYISIFTSEFTDNTYIKTKDKIYHETDDIKVNDLYQIHLFSETYNIPTNEKVLYELYDQDGNNITNQMIVENNVVSANKLNTSIKLPSIGENSYFIINTIYNDEVMSSSKLIVEIPKPTIGSGTVDDPYVIMTVDDLYYINYNMDSHFVLGTDLDLTYDTQNQDGKFYNLGKGWEAIGYPKRQSFTGSLDGYYNGVYHKIIGLNMVSGNGLFYMLHSEDTNITVKNIIFEKAVLTDSPLLSTAILGDDGVQVKIENIAAIDCEFVGESHFISKNISSIDKSGVILNSIFSNSTYTEKNGVLAGIAHSIEVDDFLHEDASADISNIQLLDRVNNKNSYYYTALFRFSSGKVNIENVIFNNNTKYEPYLFARLSKDLSENNHAYLKNIYYLDTAKMIYFEDSNFYDSDNIGSKTISELTNYESYKNWNNFNKYWYFEPLDGIARYPVLKFVSFEYTKFAEISIKKGDVDNIYNYISPKINASQNLDIDVIDDNLLTIDEDGTIHALSSGNAKVHIVNRYDGYENDIIINIIEDSKYVVKFDSNGGSGSISDFSVDYNQKINLPKNTFVKEGYTFKEWNTKYSGTGTAYSEGDEVIVTEDMTFYAIWESKEYVVSFNANGGTGVMFGLVFQHGIIQELCGNLFEKKGYSFENWNTEPDGTGISYINKQAIIVTGDLTLYAQWVPIKYTVSFNANGGTGYMVNQIFTYGVKQKLNSNLFEREGYVFVGWNTLKDGTGDYYDDYQEINVENEIILYAQWEKEIPFVINGYDVDEVNKYIDMIEVNTNVDDFKSKITLSDGYTVDVDGISIDEKKMLYTGGKVRIYKGDDLYAEYTCVIRGDVTGDGKINYLDYVYVYNHIYKSKHPESDKVLLEKENLIAADASLDNEVGYLDYVRIYNKIKELKGGSN